MAVAGLRSEVPVPHVGIVAGVHIPDGTRFAPWVPGAFDLAGQGTAHVNCFGKVVEEISGMPGD